LRIVLKNGAEQNGNKTWTKQDRNKTGTNGQHKSRKNKTWIPILPGKYTR